MVSKLGHSILLHVGGYFCNPFCVSDHEFECRLDKRLLITSDSFMMLNAAMADTGLFSFSRLLDKENVRVGFICFHVGVKLWVLWLTWIWRNLIMNFKVYFKSTLYVWTYFNYTLFDSEISKNLKLYVLLFNNKIKKKENKQTNVFYRVRKLIFL